MKVDLKNFKWKVEETLTNQAGIKMNITPAGPDKKGDNMYITALLLDLMVFV